MVCQSLEHVEAFTLCFEPSNEPMGFEKGGFCLVTVDQAQDSQWVSTVPPSIGLMMCLGWENTITVKYQASTSFVQFSVKFETRRGYDLKEALHFCVLVLCQGKLVGVHYMNLIHWVPIGLAAIRRKLSKFWLLLYSTSVLGLFGPGCESGDFERFWCSALRRYSTVQ